MGSTAYENYKNEILTNWYNSHHIDAVLMQLDRQYETYMHDDLKQELFYNLCKMPASVIVDLERRGGLRAYIFKSIYNFFNTNKSGYYHKNKISRRLIPYDFEMDDWKISNVFHYYSESPLVEESVIESEEVLDECMHLIESRPITDQQMLLLYSLLKSVWKVGEKLDTCGVVINDRLHKIRDEIQLALVEKGLITKKIQFSYTGGRWKFRKLDTKRRRDSYLKKIETVTGQLYDKCWPYSKKIFFILHRENRPLAVKEIASFITSIYQVGEQIDIRIVKRRIATELALQEKAGVIAKHKTEGGRMKFCLGKIEKEAVC